MNPFLPCQILSCDCPPSSALMWFANSRLMAFVVAIIFHFLFISILIIITLLFKLVIVITKLCEVIGRLIVVVVFHLFVL